MEPQNNKSLFHFICDQMKKLDTGEIDKDTAKAQAILAKQANNSLRYELDRAHTVMKIDNHNRTLGTDVKIREAEGKNFE